MKKAQASVSLAILGIVAVLAVVGLVLLFSRGPVTGQAGGAPGGVIPTILTGEIRDASGSILPAGLQLRVLTIPDGVIVGHGVTIEPHTDSLGTENYNLQLGVRRTEPPMEFLLFYVEPSSKRQVPCIDGPLIPRFDGGSPRVRLDIQCVPQER